MSAILGYIAVVARDESNRGTAWHTGHAPHFTLPIPSCRVLFLQSMILDHSLSGWYSGISDTVDIHHKQGKQILSKAQKDECQFTNVLKT
jgi:hypothetical protein